MNKKVIQSFWTGNKVTLTFNTPEEAEQFQNKIENLEDFLCDIDEILNKLVRIWNTWNHREIPGDKAMSRLKDIKQKSEEWILYEE